MGMATFKRMKMRQLEAMKPENIIARQAQETKVEEEKPIEKVEETKEEIEITEEETPRRRTTRRHT